MAVKARSRYGHFEDWLRARNYRPATVRSTMAGLPTVLAQLQRDEPFDVAHVRHVAKRYAAWRADVGDNATVRRLAALGASPTTRKLSAKPTRRKYVAQSFSESEWLALHEMVRGSDDLRDIVIECMMATGLRVGDVLRIDRRVLKRGLNHGALELERKGGTFITVPIAVAAPWRRLLAYMPSRAVTVAEAISGDPNVEAGNPAYQRVQRRVKSHCEGLGVEGRAHTHRFRRTVAVRAHRLTQDVQAVQQMLGHRNPTTTMKYLDEDRGSQIAELQHKLAGGLYDTLDEED